MSPVFYFGNYFHFYYETIVGNLIPSFSLSTLWRKIDGNWVNYFSRPISDLYVLDLPKITEVSSEFRLTWREKYESPSSPSDLLLDTFTAKAVKETSYKYSLVPSKTYCYRNAAESSCAIFVDWETNDLRSPNLCLRISSEQESINEPVCLSNGVIR